MIQKRKYRVQAILSISNSKLPMFGLNIVLSSINIQLYNCYCNILICCNKSVYALQNPACSLQVSFPQSALRQLHSLFHNEFPRDYGIVLPLSSSTSYSFLSSGCLSLLLRPFFTSSSMFLSITCFRRHSISET